MVNGGARRPTHALAAVAGLMLLSAGPLAAQARVALQFSGNLVTVSAHDAPLAMILSEWARVGGITVVNGERLAGPRMTVELINVPEQQALDVLLRDVAGYVLAARTDKSPGPSAFGRLLVLPTSSVPSSVAATPSPAAPAQRTPPPLPPMLARHPELGVEGRPPQGPANSGAGNGNVPVAMVGPGTRTDPAAIGAPSLPPPPKIPAP